MAIGRRQESSVTMVASTVYVIAFLVLVLWRLVFAAQHRRQLRQEMAPRQQRQIKLLGGVDMAVIAGGGFENGSQDADPVEGEDRAITYLRRIIALTGATQTGGISVLDVGTTRFYVCDRHIRRLLDVTDPKCEYEETCFYVPHKGMPTAEQTATVLLELRNNPALFDRWAARIGAVRADGQVFSGG